MQKAKRKEIICKREKEFVNLNMIPKTAKRVKLIPACYATSQGPHVPSHVLQLKVPIMVEKGTRVSSKFQPCCLSNKVNSARSFLKPCRFSLFESLFSAKLHLVSECIVGVVEPFRKCLWYKGCPATSCIHCDCATPQVEVEALCLVSFGHTQQQLKTLDFDCKQRKLIIILLPHCSVCELYSC